MSENKWLFIGTDRRLEECENLMLNAGYDCRYVKTDSYSKELEQSLIDFRPDNIVFPILQMKGKIPIRYLQQNTVLYTGVATEEWRNHYKKAGLRTECYLEEELYIWENAQITAEAFLKEFYKQTGRMIFSHSFIVAGFGRVGKMAAETIKQLGGIVTVVARSETQLAEAQLRGFKTFEITTDFPIEDHYLVNTIPAKWFNSNIRKPLFIFDLASAPGCLAEAESFEYYKLLPGLPGKHFPLDAAIALKGALERIHRR